MGNRKMGAPVDFAGWCLAGGFTTLLTAAVNVLRALNPGEPDEPLKAQTDVLNWDIDQATKLLTD